MQAQYGWYTAKRDYEAKYINTGYGKIIKNAIEDYIKNTPISQMSENDIKNKIDQKIYEGLGGYTNIGMDYSFHVLSIGDRSADIIVSTYRTSDPREERQIVDYIAYLV